MYGLEMVEAALDAWILEGESLLHRTVQELGESPILTDLTLTHVEMLLQKGVNVDARNKNKATPLHVAVKYANLAMVKLLVAHRADLEALNKHGATPLHNACREGSPEIVSYLIRIGCNINAMTHDQDTPLHQAVHKNKIDNMVLLILAGADTDKKNHQGRKAKKIKSEQATKLAYADAVKAMIDLGGSF